MNERVPFYITWHEAFGVFVWTFIIIIFCKLLDLPEEVECRPGCPCCTCSCSSCPVDDCSDCESCECDPCEPDPIICGNSISSCVRCGGSPCKCHLLVCPRCSNNPCLCHRVPECMRSSPPPCSLPCPPPCPKPTPCCKPLPSCCKPPPSCCKPPPSCCKSPPPCPCSPPPTCGNCPDCCKCYWEASKALSHAGNCAEKLAMTASCGDCNDPAAAQASAAAAQAVEACNRAILAHRKAAAACAPQCPCPKSGCCPPQICCPSSSGSNTCCPEPKPKSQGRKTIIVLPNNAPAVGSWIELSCSDSDESGDSCCGSGGSGDENNYQCVVCCTNSCDLKQQNQMLMQAPCGHLFCCRCARIIVKNRRGCPICKACIVLTELKPVC